MTEPKYKVVATIDDDTHENPTEWSDEREVYSFNRRHCSFKDPDDFGLTGRPPDVTSTRFGLRKKLEAGTAFILSCYQHSGIVWSLMGEGMQDRWDTAQVAGLLFQKGKRGESYEKRAERARDWLEVYNAWCNGEVYLVRLVQIDPETDDEITDLEVSSGHYGTDDAEYAAKEMCADHGVPYPGITYD